MALPTLELLKFCTFLSNSKTAPPLSIGNHLTSFRQSLTLICKPVVITFHLSFSQLMMYLLLAINMDFFFVLPRLFHFSLINIVSQTFDKSKINIEKESEKRYNDATPKAACGMTSKTERKETIHFG
jgi:hypothetical protein